MDTTSNFLFPIEPVSLAYGSLALAVIALGITLYAYNIDRKHFWQWLVGVIIICTIGLVSVFLNNSQLKIDMEQCNLMIQKRDSTILSLQNSISLINKDLNKLTKEREELETIFCSAHFVNCGKREMCRVNSDKYAAMPSYVVKLCDWFGCQPD